MNLVVAGSPLGPDLAPAALGAVVRHALPCGEIDFVVGAIAGFGRLDSASLFSPMFGFADRAAVRAVAIAVAEEIARPAEPASMTVAAEPVVAAARTVDRRGLLFGRRRDTEAGTWR